MASERSSKATKSLPKAQTLEVPKVLNISVSEGIINVSGDDNLSLLFRHLQDSMNDKNDVKALKALAKVHGYEVKEESE